MKTKQSISIAMLSIGAILFSLTSAGSASGPSGKSLVDFSNASAAGQWLSVNDGVMGGVSEGSFRITGDNTLLFSGRLSLENNGGFTSIRTRPTDLNLSDYDTIVTRVKGDGRRYYFNLRTAMRQNAASYRAPVKTQQDTWQEVRIPLADFVYTAYGRRVYGAKPLQAGDIQSVGFTLADKQAGPFRLEISSIRAENSRASTQVTKGQMDIVDTAVAAGQFKTLVTALEAAGLVDALRAEGPLTVFAPTDEAFAKLPAGTVDELLKPENKEQLVAVLTYHVLPGKTALRTQSLDTLQGQALTINGAASFQVNGAGVVQSDILTSNGLIHVIDTVLIPPSTQATPKQDARALIELAIQRGVPLYNSGQASACTAIYEVAANSLLTAHTQTLEDQDRAALNKALRDIRSGDQNASQQAWTMRYALDKVYASLSAEG